MIGKEASYVEAIQTKPYRQSHAAPFPLEFFACPNPDCASFNIFGAGNLSVAEHMGKDKAIRRLYCNICHTRFSERQGSLMQYSKLPKPVVVRIIKCLGHGCSIEATADICEVDTRTVQRLLDRAGKRAETFHNLQLEKLQEPIQAVQMDELHGRVSGWEKKKGPLARIRSVLRGIAKQDETGSMWRWR